MRPRCCLRYLTFFGINIISSQLLERAYSLRLAFFGWQNFAAINPALHADHSVRGPGFRKSVFNISAQRVQWQAPLQIPLGTRDFISIQTPAHADLDSLAPETQCRINRLAHRATKTYALFQLQR